jgi:hypothetical protein
LAARTIRAVGWLLTGLSLVVVVACGDDATSGTTTSSTQARGELEDAISVADRGLELDLATDEVGGLIEALCTVAAGAANDDLLARVRAIPAPSSPELATALGALAEGAETRCPAEADELSPVVGSTYEAVGHEFDAGTEGTTVVTQIDEPFEIESDG